MNSLIAPRFWIIVAEDGFFAEAGFAADVEDCANGGGPYFRWLAATGTPCM